MARGPAGHEVSFQVVPTLVVTEHASALSRRGCKSEYTRLYESMTSTA
jgi:hypothetical protein